MKHPILLLLCLTGLLFVQHAAAQPASPAPPTSSSLASDIETTGQAVITLRNDAVEKTSDELRELWQYELVVIEDRPITVGKLIIAIILLSLAIWLSKGASAFVGRFILPRLGLEDGGLVAVQSILFYLFVLFFALFALRIVNVPLTMFTVIGGALAIGVGFGSQNIMSNFISGLIMLVEQHVRVGDRVEVDGLKGIVKHVGPRSTTIRTSDNIDIVMPNSYFLDKRVINWTLGDNMVRFSLNVGVSYESNIQLVSQLLLQVAEENLHVLSDPAPSVRCVAFAPDTIDFQLLCFMYLNTTTEPDPIQSELRYRIFELFTRHGISFGFPQREVHLDTDKPLQIKIATD